jgi:hypothetical protein
MTLWVILVKEPVCRGGMGHEQGAWSEIGRSVGDGQETWSEIGRRPLIIVDKRTYNSIFPVGDCVL